MIDYKFPISNLTDIKHTVDRNMYYTILDLTPGFHQIQMVEKSIQKTAFNTE